MPEYTVIQKRDKAIISLQALCFLRISELKTVKIKNLNEEDGNYFIYVSPKSMSVKGAKTRHADFLPLPDDIRNNVISWRDYLIEQGFDSKEPLFPQVPNQFDQHSFIEGNLSHSAIKADTTIRKIFKKAFTTAGYEYIKPHNFRHAIVKYAGKHSPELLNAIR